MTTDQKIEKIIESIGLLNQKVEILANAINDLTDKEQKPMSVKEISEKLDIHPNTVRRYKDRGVIIPINNGGGKLLFLPSEVEKIKKKII